MPARGCGTPRPCHATVLCCARATSEGQEDPSWAVFRSPPVAVGRAGGQWGTLTGTHPLAQTEPWQKVGQSPSIASVHPGDVGSAPEGAVPQHPGLAPRAPLPPAPAMGTTMKCFCPGDEHGQINACARLVLLAAAQRPWCPPCVPKSLCPCTPWQRHQPRVWPRAGSSPGYNPTAATQRAAGLSRCKDEFQ